MRRVVVFGCLLSVVLAGDGGAVRPTDTITTFHRGSEAAGALGVVAKFGPRHMIIGRIDRSLVRKEISADVSAPGTELSPSGSATRALAVDWARGFVYYVPFNKHEIRRVAINKGGLLAGPTLAQTSELVAGSASVSGFAGNGAKPGPNTRFNSPSALAVGVDGTLYIADMNNHSVRQIAPGGIVKALAGSSGTIGQTGDGGQAYAATLKYPSSLSVAENGDVLIASDRAMMRRVRPNGVISTVNSFVMRGAALDAAGNLYFSGYPGGIWKISDYLVGTNIQEIVRSSPVEAYGGDGGDALVARLARPEALAVDELGSLYIVDRNNNRVRKIRNYPPSVAITCDRTSGSVPLTVTCTPRASDPNGSIVRYSWNFGGVVSLATVKGGTQTHVFKTTGSKVARLTVMDDSGARSSAEVAITVR